jgi:sulfur-carrier protein
MSNDMLDDVAVHAGTEASTLQLQVRYFAGAAAAAGLPAETVELPSGADLATLRVALVERHPRLEPVLAAATLLVDEVAVNDTGASLASASQVDVLPPFAGG